MLKQTFVVVFAGALAAALVAGLVLEARGTSAGAERPGAPATPMPSVPPRGAIVPGTDIQVNADVLMGSQNETTLVECGGRLVAAWNDSSRGVGSARSEDGGDSWTDGGVLQPPRNGYVGGDPALAANSDCMFYLATITGFEDGSYIGVATSANGGQTFGPQVRAGAGLAQGSRQDKPWLAVDNTGGPRHGAIYLCWTEFPQNLAARLLFSRSTDGGATFEPAQALTSPGRFDFLCQVAVGPQGEVYVSWTSLFPRALRIRRSDDGGLSFGPQRVVSTLEQTGHLAECNDGTRNVKDGNIRVLEGTPSLAVDQRSGTVYLAWHDRGAGDDEGDIFIARSTDLGEHWSDPMRLNDDATTNDQFQPAVAVNPDGALMVMWYDRRLDPNNTLIDVFAAVSVDGAKSFAPNERISDVSFGIKSHTQSSCYMGDYNGIVGTASNFHLVWGDNRNLDRNGEPPADVFSDLRPAPALPPATPTPSTPLSPTFTPAPTATPSHPLVHDVAVTNVEAPADVTIDVSGGPVWTVEIPVRVTIQNQGDHPEGSPEPADGVVTQLIAVNLPPGCLPRTGIRASPISFTAAVAATDLAPGEIAVSVDTVVEVTCSSSLPSGDFGLAWGGIASTYEHGDVIQPLAFHDADPADNTYGTGQLWHVRNPARPFGDASCDGSANSIDAALILQYDAGLIDSLECQPSADVNGDGRVNSIDSALILQYGAGLLHALRA